MLWRLFKFVAWGWAIVVGGMGVLGSLFAGRQDLMAYLVVALVGFAPLGLLFWALQARRARWADVHARMLEAAGGRAVAYEHGEEGSGLALNPSARTVTLLEDGLWKTYAYRDVRRWKTNFGVADHVVPVNGGLGAGMVAMGANLDADRTAAVRTGLFVEVRDLERPKWRVAMRDESLHARWMEIFEQQINEAGRAAA